MFKPATNAPKTIPAKYRKHIQFYDDERSSGNGIILTLVGLAYQDANSDAACHVFGEDTVKELNESLAMCEPCNCKVCQDEQKEEAKTISLQPTWEQALGTLLAVLESGTPKGKMMAMEELQRMAKAADCHARNQVKETKKISLSFADFTSTETFNELLVLFGHGESMDDVDVFTNLDITFNTETCLPVTSQASS